MKQKQLDYECTKVYQKQKALEYYYNNKVSNLERMKEYNKQYWEKIKEKISAKQKWKYYNNIRNCYNKPQTGMTICKDITLYFK